MELQKVMVVEGYDVPEDAGKKNVHRLLPKKPDPAYYAARTDRNIGWITEEEQKTVHGSIIGVAGCGGMGGRLAEVLVRLGVGELRIADSETFDASNINRQLAATRLTVGRSKAWETARALRSITDDMILAVYPSGIAEDVAAHFVAGCDAVCDEIEFWCIGSRILLHRAARELGVPVFVCNTVGFGSHVFLFTPDGATMEECLGMHYEEAAVLERNIIAGRATQAEILRVAESMARGLFFEWSEYGSDKAEAGSRDRTRRRLIAEGKGAIIATNPPLACGLVADHILLYLLRKSASSRSVVEIPPMPGYLYFDAARMQAKVVRRAWW